MRHCLHYASLQQRGDQGKIRAVRREQRRADTHAELRYDVVNIETESIEHDLPRERVPVGMEP